MTADKPTCFISFCLCPFMSVTRFLFDCLLLNSSFHSQQHVCRLFCRLHCGVFSPRLLWQWNHLKLGQNQRGGGGRGGGGGGERGKLIGGGEIGGDIERVWKRWKLRFIKEGRRKDLASPKKEKGKPRERGNVTEREGDEKEAWTGSRMRGGGGGGGKVRMWRRRIF